VGARGEREEGVPLPNERVDMPPLQKVEFFT